jgi:uncharacterized protein
MAKKVRILSIDGGGIRGIIPGTILTALEQKLIKKSGKADARLADFFDIVAGTSTGGILSCLYLVPGENGRPRFNAQTAVELYLQNGDKIFSIPIFHRVRTVNGVRDEKYPAEELERILRNYVGDAELKDLLKPCLITAYDIFQRHAAFFRQHEAKKDEASNYYVRDVARCTSAAPTYFECALVKPPRFPVETAYVDGGVYANNPTLCAYAEVRTMKPALKAEDMIIVSLGTGSADLKAYSYSEARNWGLAEWAIPVLDIFSSGQAETITYQLQKMFETIPAVKGRDYYRLNPRLDSQRVNPAMDCATRENMTALNRLGIDYATAEDAQLEKIADLLIANGVKL